MVTKALVGIVVVVAATVMLSGVMARPWALGGVHGCLDWGALHDPADVADLGPFRLLTNQPVERRDPCNGDGTYHYSLPPDVDGILFDDCIVSWVGGGRSYGDHLCALLQSS